MRDDVIPYSPNLGNTESPLGFDASDRIHIRINSNRVTDWFLIYLENKL